MTFKVLLTTLVLTLFTCLANANDGKYTLTFKLENKWVAQQDLMPLKEAVAFFQNNDLKIQATCSKQDVFCKKRVEIINHIFKKQNVKQQISSTIISTKIDKNTIVLESINLDFNKYSNLFINYKNKSLVPEKDSTNKFSKILKKSEQKYLSKFKMYCKNVDQLCKDRFNYLSDIIGKTLTFKYNFALYENPNLDNNQIQIVNHRHDYNIHNPIAKPKTTAAIEKKKALKKKTKPTLKYSQKENIIVFNKDSSALAITEKIKIENLIINSKNNKFNFICNQANQNLCQARLHTIKNYALKNTSNIIEMYQVDRTTKSNFVIVMHK